MVKLLPKAKIAAESSMDATLLPEEPPSNLQRSSTALVKIEKPQSTSGQCKEPNPLPKAQPVEFKKAATPVKEFPHSSAGSSDLTPPDQPDSPFPIRLFHEIRMIMQAFIEQSTLVQKIVVVIYISVPILFQVLGVK